MSEKEICICHPYTNQHVYTTPTGVWVASGTTSHRMGVTGSVAGDKTRKKCLSKRTILSESRLPDGTRVYRWVILFQEKFDPAECYTLTVEWKQVTATVTGLRFQGKETVKGKANSEKFISVTSHNDEDNITNQANPFTPFGELRENHTLESVTMNGVPAGWSQSDPGLETWVAQFDSLGPGSYTLQVRDSGNDTDTVTPLIVDEP